MEAFFKADVHVHSRHSDRPSSRSLRRLNCPESYADPLVVLRHARERGMNFVTVTDHDTLEGSLRIAEEPNTFLSSEVTVAFPDHDCEIHVVVLGVDEVQFGDVLELRDNVYALVDYLDWEDITHFVAHPLYAASGTMTMAVFEKLLLLFNAFEVRNGARPARLNNPVDATLAALTPWHIEELANRYAMEPRGPLPWLKARVGGSDDHTGLYAGGCHTVVPGDGTIGAFLSGIRGRLSMPGGSDGDPRYLAHSIYAVAREHILHALDSGTLGGKLLGRRFPRGLVGCEGDPGLGREGDKFAAQCIHALRSVLPVVTGADQANCVEHEVTDLVRRLWQPSDQHDVKLMNERIFTVAADVVRRAATAHGRRFVGAVRGLHPLRAARPLAGLAMVHGLSLPYYVAYHDHSAERGLVAEIEERFAPGGAPPRKEKIVLFTDTLADVNGVALTIRRLQRAAAAQGTNLVVASCDDGSGVAIDDATGTVTFPACAELALPHYEEFVLRTPSLLDVLDYLDTTGATAIHASTPGPMGIVALLAARILRLPIAATYHTDVPGYARILTGRAAAGGAAWAYVIAFYRLVDEVLVPSASTRRQLIAHGLPAERISPLPRWVDTELFTPVKRDLGIWRRYDVGPATKLLYAGRVSREKNLELLADTFEELLAAGCPVHLIIAGDGPYRAAMQKRLRGLPATFLGFLTQGELAHVYAASDLFVFPSATDTFGNVVLEAQAAGLPVIVTDKGGPNELMQHGNTGFVVPANDGRALLAALQCLLTDPGRLALMSLQARRFILANQLSVEQQYETLLRAPRISRHRRWQRPLEPGLA